MAAPVRPGQHSLFGGVDPARPAAPAFRSAKANGYAAPPGTGPEDETCGSCGNCIVRELKAARGRRFYKCEVMLRSWTNERSSDVLLNSPACKHFKPGAPRSTTVRQLRDKTWKD